MYRQLILWNNRKQIQLLVHATNLEWPAELFPHLEVLALTNKETMMTQLPPELVALAKLLDAQTKPVQAAFQYCLALMMVEAGKAELIATASGDEGMICTFRTIAGDEFSLAKPPITEERETVIRKTLRTILDDEDSL